MSKRGAPLMSVSVALGDSSDCLPPWRQQNVTNLPIQPAVMCKLTEGTVVSCTAGGSTSVYMFQNGRLRRFPSPAIYASWGAPTPQVVEIAFCTQTDACPKGPDMTMKETGMHVHCSLHINNDGITTLYCLAFADPTCSIPNGQVYNCNGQFYKVSQP